MTTSAYHRYVLALLRDDYGVTDAELTHGGRHARVIFTYAGELRHITLNNKAFGPRAFDMKRLDILHLLGNPPPRPARERRTMEDLMPRLNQLPLQDDFGEHVVDISAAIDNTRNDALVAGPSAITAKGKLAIYASGIKFYIPAEIANTFGASEQAPVRITVTQNDHELWTITPRSGYKRPSLHYANRVKCYEINWLECDSLALCGLSPAEYLVEGSTILVRCPLATRVPVTPHVECKPRQRRKMLELTNAVQPSPSDIGAVTQSVEEQIVKNFADITNFGAASEADVRACLDALRRIEATTPYRLGRRTSTGAWCFSAPRIE